MYDKELLEIKKKVDKLLAHKTPQYKQGYNTAIDDFAEIVIAELQKAKHEIKLCGNDLDIYRGAMICAIETVKDLRAKLQSRTEL